MNVAGESGTSGWFGSSHCVHNAETAGSIETTETAADVRTPGSRTGNQGSAEGTDGGSVFL